MSRELEIGNNGLACARPAPQPFAAIRSQTNRKDSTIVCCGGKMPAVRVSGSMTATDCGLRHGVLPQ